MLYIQCIAISISPPTIQGAFKRQPLKLLIWIMFFHFPLWSNLKCLHFYKFSACDRRGKLNFHFHSFQRHWVASHRLCPHCPSSDLYGMAWHGMVWYGMVWPPPYGIWSLLSCCFIENQKSCRHGKSLIVGSCCVTISWHFSRKFNFYVLFQIFNRQFFKFYCGVTILTTSWRNKFWENFKLL